MLDLKDQDFINYLPGHWPVFDWRWYELKSWCNRRRISLACSCWVSQWLLAFFLYLSGQRTAHCSRYQAEDQSFPHFECCQSSVFLYLIFQKVKIWFFLFCEILPEYFISTVILYSSVFCIQLCHVGGAGSPSVVRSVKPPSCSLKI